MSLSCTVRKVEREKIVVVRCVYHYYIQLHSIFILSSFIMKKYNFSYLHSRQSKKYFLCVQLSIRKIQSRSCAGCRYFCNIHILFSTLLSSRLLPYVAMLKITNIFHIFFFLSAHDLLYIVVNYEQK